MAASTTTPLQPSPMERWIFTSSSDLTRPAGLRMPNRDPRVAQRTPLLVSPCRPANPPSSRDVSVAGRALQWAAGSSPAASFVSFDPGLMPGNPLLISPHLNLTANPWERRLLCVDRQSVHFTGGFRPFCSACSVELPPALCLVGFYVAKSASVPFCVVAGELPMPRLSNFWRWGSLLHVVPNGRSTHCNSAGGVHVPNRRVFAVSGALSRPL